jgi:hypothetical protein
VELAEETIEACEEANGALKTIFVRAFRLYPEPEPPEENA